MRPEETIDYNIKRTWYNITKMYNRTASQYKASMSLGMILLNINIAEGTPSTKLGPNMGMEATSLSRSLKKLEKEKLIKRKNDLSDKRKSIIYLTNKGVKWREIAKHKVLDFNKKISKNIHKKEMDTFFSVIKKINNIIDAHKK